MIKDFANKTSFDDLVINDKSEAFKMLNSAIGSCNKKNQEILILA